MTIFSIGRMELRRWNKTVFPSRAVTPTVILSMPEDIHQGNSSMPWQPFLICLQSMGVRKTFPMLWELLQEMDCMDFSLKTMNQAKSLTYPQGDVLFWFSYLARESFQEGSKVGQDFAKWRKRLLGCRRFEMSRAAGVGDDSYSFLSGA